MAPTNKAAFLKSKGTPLSIESTTYTSPGKDEIVVKNVALAINPFDWINTEACNLVIPWAKFPIILGTDIAGEVVEVGEGVTRFKVGDRVLSYAVGMAKDFYKNSGSGFQQYTVALTSMTSHIPDGMSYEAASVIPLGLATAASALFQKDNLALPLPSTPIKSTGKTVLIWGGSTSVGCNAIQLAVAAGNKVITTASPKNHAYLKSLGASQVFDYNSKTVVADIVSAFKGKTSAGAISIGRGSFSKCVEILGSVQGSKFVAQATLDMPPFPKGMIDFPPFLFAFISASIKGKIQTTMKGVTSKFINGAESASNEVGLAIFQDFLPVALEKGTFVPAPQPQVVGQGLDSIEEAMKMSKRGVSAKKLVITL